MGCPASLELFGGTSRWHRGWGLSRPLLSATGSRGEAGEGHIDDSRGWKGVLGKPQVLMLQECT